MSESIVHAWEHVTGGVSVYCGASMDRDGHIGAFDWLQVNCPRCFHAAATSKQSPRGKKYKCRMCGDEVRWRDVVRRIESGLTTDRRYMIHYIPTIPSADHLAYGVEPCGPVDEVRCLE